MEIFETIGDFLRFIRVKPITGADKYKLGQGINEAQAQEIRQILARAAKWDLNNVPQEEDISNLRSSYWLFIGLNLAVLGIWGKMYDEYYDKQRRKLWNTMNTQEKEAAYTFMEKELAFNLDKCKWAK